MSILSGMGAKVYKQPLGACGLCGGPITVNMGLLLGAEGEPVFEFCSGEHYVDFYAALRGEYESDERARQREMNALPF